MTGHPEHRAAGGFDEGKASSGPSEPNVRSMLHEDRPPQASARVSLPRLDLRSRRFATLALAAIGGALLLIVAVYRWAIPQDETAYWLAAQRLANGLPLYDPAASPGTPFAYLYPPPLAQALAPFTSVVPSWLYVALYTALLLVALWWLGGRDVLVALALVAFVPVAVELWYRNVHLLLAMLLVLSIRRLPWLFAIGAAIKVAPILGIVYLAAKGRWRDAARATLVGMAILAVSVALAPDAWRQFLQIVAAPNLGSEASIIPVPFPVRAIVAAALAVVAGRIRARIGEPLLVVAVTIGNPTLYVTGLSLLIAIVPLVRWQENPLKRVLRGPA